jgi:putative transposase
MEEIMRSVCADFECELVEFNGEDNHVHLLVNFPPKVAVTKLVNSLKCVSSRRLRQEFPDFPDLVPHYWRGPSRRSAPRVVNTGRPAPPTRNPRRSASPRQIRFTTGLKPVHCE